MIHNFSVRDCEWDQRRGSENGIKEGTKSLPGLFQYQRSVGTFDTWINKWHRLAVRRSGTVEVEVENIGELWWSRIHLRAEGVVIAK